MEICPVTVTVNPPSEDSSRSGSQENLLHNLKGIASTGQAPHCGIDELAFVDGEEDKNLDAVRQPVIINPPSEDSSRSILEENLVHHMTCIATNGPAPDLGIDDTTVVNEEEEENLGAIRPPVIFHPPSEDSSRSTAEQKLVHHMKLIRTNRQADDFGIPKLALVNEEDDENLDAIRYIDYISNTHENLMQNRNCIVTAGQVHDFGVDDLHFIDDADDEDVDAIRR